MALLADKKIWQSWTAWGVLLLTLGGALVEGATEVGFITEDGAQALADMVQKAGGPHALRPA